MTLRCIALIGSVALLFFAGTCYSQPIDTLAFAKHLKQAHLFNEQIAFNKTQQAACAFNLPAKDSLLLDLAFIYYQVHLKDSCKKSLLQISSTNYFSDSLSKLRFTLLVLNQEYAIAESSISNFNENEKMRGFNAGSSLSLKMLERNFDKNDTIINLYPLATPLLDIKARYINYPNYSPALAGIYSSIVPGLGKWYIGYKYQAITAFASNALLAGQAVESLLKAGVKSPRFIITAGLFGVFYTGNIIGSITMTKKKKKDYFNQLDYELLDYYSTGITSVYK